ncbi:hypothetical protein M3J09_003484 [Ascochyta lentis]
MQVASPAVSDTWRQGNGPSTIACFGTRGCRIGISLFVLMRDGGANWSAGYVVIAM